jgi:hypothetical protein
MTDSLKARQRVSRLKLALFAGAVIAFAGDGVALWAWRSGQLSVIDLSTLLIVCSVLGIAAAGTALTYTPGAIADSRTLTAADNMQKDRIWRLIVTTGVGLLLTGQSTTQAVEAFREGALWSGYGSAVVVLAWLCAAPAALMGWREKAYGSEPDDELSRAFRARATATGFWALLAGGGVTFLISLSHPAALPWFLPFALWFGGAVACAHFVWLHYRAEQDLEDDG